MRVLAPEERITADFREVASINLSLSTLAAICKFQPGEEFNENDGLGPAIGQSLQTNEGRQFALIQHFQAPVPTNDHTYIVSVNGEPAEVERDVITILKEMDLSAGNLVWVRDDLDRRKISESVLNRTRQRFDF